MPRAEASEGLLPRTDGPVAHLRRFPRRGRCRKRHSAAPSDCRTGFRRACEVGRAHWPRDQAMRRAPPGNWSPDPVAPRRSPRPRGSACRIESAAPASVCRWRAGAARPEPCANRRSTRKRPASRPSKRSTQTGKARTQRSLPGTPHQPVEQALQALDQPAASREQQPTKPGPASVQLGIVLLPLIFLLTAAQSSLVRAVRSIASSENCQDEGSGS